MFILPTFENAKIKRVPWATIGIIICCCWVFLFLQKDDYEKLENLIVEYGQNGLFDIEAEAFLAYQKKRPEDEQVWLPEQLDDIVLPDQKKNKKKYDEWVNYYAEVWSTINYDLEFQNELRAHLLIPPGSSKYDKWIELKQAYELDLKEVIQVQYAFRTAWPDFVTSFTSLFIHADVYHLLGNMVFLFIAGTILEAVIGSWAFLLVYLVIGIAESWLTIPLIGSSATGSIGASGAISGIMGAYSVLLGRTMVPAFVSFGFYFTNIRVPAFSLIVFWLLKELLYEFLYPDSRVNYMAHFAGFMLGGSIGVLLKVWKGEVAKALFDAPEEGDNNDVDHLLASSVEHLRNLEPEKARKCITNALWIKPDNINILKKLFDIDKQGKDKHVFKRTTIKLLTLMVDKPDLSDDSIKVFKEYHQTCGLDLPAELLSSVATLLIKHQEVDSLLELVKHLRAEHSGHEQIPLLLLNSCSMLLRQKKIKMANILAIDLVKNYASSSEASAVKSLFASWKEQQVVSSTG